MPELSDSLVVNATLRQILLAAQEVIGERNLELVLRAAGLERFAGVFPPDDQEPAVSACEFGRLNEAIERSYGRSGRSVLRRIGKAAFQRVLREQPTLLSLAGSALQLLPPRQRVRFVLESLASASNGINPGAEAWVEERNDGLAYVERTCAICAGRAAEEPLCHLSAGLIGEAVSWATDSSCEVLETHCIARGDACCRFTVRQSRA